MNSPKSYQLLADAILFVHFAYVLFVVLGLALIWIGFSKKWVFVRGFWFRITHLTAIGFVAAESLLGVFCPLTLWENQSRAKAGMADHGDSFVQYWVHRVLFWDAPEGVFTALYSAFFVLIALSFWFVRPEGPCGKSGAGKNS